MPAKLFSGSHMKWLMEAKEDLPAAANNRRKYFSAMLGWALNNRRRWLPATPPAM